MKRVLTMIHHKCRNSIYPSTNIERFHVEEETINWDVTFKSYSPVIYTSKALQGKPWADPDIEDENFKPKWNALDGNGTINRVSYVSKYDIDENNYPLNPCGRTGIHGRGLLGRWGPNHAADPIVTRWKRNEDNSVVIEKSDNKPILQFIGIQRKDSGEWALPGGMVDPNENVSATLRREFMEEALNSLQKSVDELTEAKRLIENFFESGVEIYKGYVDDPRNTDNAWMETVAFNFHDETGDIVGNMKLQAGDDAKNVRWIDISDDLTLYASHKDLIHKVVKNRNAHW